MSIRSNGVQETSVAATSEYELEDVVAPPAAGSDEEEADKYLEIGLFLYKCYMLHMRKYTNRLR